MATVRFTVEYLTPPSVNHTYLPCMYTGKDGFAHRGRKISKQAIAYKDAVAIFARGLTVAPVTNKERRTVRYAVQMDVYLGPKQRGDADNFLKVGIDALVGAGVIHSDAFVHESKAIVHKDQRHNPRTEYVVTRLETN